MGYLANQPVLWPLAPNWANALTESLTWLTEVLQATNGSQQAMQLREMPRRAFALQGLADADLRRLVDAIRFDLGVQRFLLPIYADAQRLASDVAAAATSIPCATTGYDFADSGNALLYRAANDWEIAAIDTVEASALALSTATANAWSAGTRLYPLRHARLADAPTASADTDELTSVQMHLAIDEPCSWTAAWPSAASYRSVPVLEWRGDESTAPDNSYARNAASVDDDVGGIYYYDTAGMPFRAQTQHFALHGRADHATFRSLLYQLAGRASQLWVPSWQNDVRLTQDIGASDTALSAAWMGYALFGHTQVNRRDLRVELYDGSIFYRRVTDASASGDTETLTLDASLGQTIHRTAIRQINWLSVCSLAADAVTLSHVTDADGVATCDLHWEARKNDV